MKATIAAIALMLTTGAATADTYIYSGVRPVLELEANLCPVVKQLALDWARQHKTSGSFALPIKRGNPNAPCDEAIPARSGFTFSYDNRVNSDATALQECTAQNAGNPDVGHCVIVARLRPGPV